MRALLLVTCLLVALSLGGISSAAPFLNLGFDDANTNSVQDGWGPVSDLLPHWQINAQENDFSYVGFNRLSSGVPYLTVYDKSQELEYDFDVEGNFAVWFSFHFNSEFTLSQTGTVPNNAQILSVRMRGSSFERVTFDGHRLDEFNFSGPDSEVLRWVITPFAGQTGALVFYGSEIFGVGRSSAIDSSSFSIPEPSRGMLLIVGTLLLWAIISSRRAWNGNCDSS